MTTELEYQDLRLGNWALKVLPAQWSDQLQDLILRLVRRQRPSRHPQTLRLTFPDQTGDSLFLKVFHPGSAAGTVKDYFRQSKAFRSLRQGIALSRAQFRVPTTIAAGEERYYRFLKCAFVLTFRIHGEPLPVFLHQRYADPSQRISLAQKRDALKALGLQIRHLHLLGFVHGDLVPSNIIISEKPVGELDFYLMDNDRTRRYPRWFPQSFWKRNLVQLNRFPLPGISLQDRMRFFRAYSGRADWSRADRELLRWLERKTRARRKECDAADVTVSFRRLMKWNREFVDNV